MGNTKEKVIHLSKETADKANDAAAEEEQTASEEEAAAKKPEKLPKSDKGRDMGKAAVFISVLTVLLLLVFFYALNRNVTGLATQVEQLGSLEQRVDQMDGTIADMRNEMAVLQEVPAIAKRTMLRSMLQDLSQRTDFIAGEAESEEQSAKLQQAKELLEEVQQELQQ